MKRRGRTAAKTRRTIRVKWKGSDTPLIARRDNSRAAGLEKQVRALTRKLSEAREAEQHLLHSSVQFAILVQSIKDYAIYMLDKAGRIIDKARGLIPRLTKVAGP